MIKNFCNFLWFYFFVNFVGNSERYQLSPKWKFSSKNPVSSYAAENKHECFERL